MLKRDILNDGFMNAIREFDVLHDPIAYEECWRTIRAAQTLYRQQYPSLRVTYVLSDGTVWMDSGLGQDPNTYESARAKQVNENHASRLAIRDAQDSEDGWGVEQKYSTTMNREELYVAKRLGARRASLGVIRISVSI